MSRQSQGGCEGYEDVRGRGRPPGQADVGMT